MTDSFLLINAQMDGFHFCHSFLQIIFTEIMKIIHFLTFVIRFCLVHIQKPELP